MNTFFVTPKEPIEIIVGDDKKPDFKPQVKFQRWDNECNLSIRLKTDKKQTPVEKDGKISTENTRFYEVENGYEFEVILDKKPKTNIVEFTLEDKGVTYHYQPPLTKREIEAGHIMPENVIGSYAVYTDKVGGKYKVGKVGHIYRPEIIDASGNKVWGKLHIENKILSVTVPQEFLDKAKYPVIVDPTFGYTTAGASAGRISATQVDFRQGNYFTAPANGTLDSLHASLALYSGTNFKAKGFVNEKDSVASGSHGQIATAEITTQTGSQSWRTFTLGNEKIEKDTDYILNVQGLKGENAQFFYDNVDYDGSNSTLYGEGYSVSTYGSPESPWLASKVEGIAWLTEWELGATYDPYFVDGEDSCTKAGDYPKKWYQCIEYHISSEDNEPGVGANWEDYWGDAGNIPTERYSVYVTYTETDRTATHTALPIEVIIPSITAASKEERTATHTPLEVNATIPSITASSVEVRTAEYTATSLMLTVPSVTATRKEERVATHEPISINLSIPLTTATSEEEATALFEAISVVAVVPETTAESKGLSVASYVPLELKLTTPPIAATRDEESTATYAFLEITATIPETTAIRAEENTVAIDPLSVLATIPSITATSKEEVTATYTPIIISLVPPEMAASYLAEATASFDPLTTKVTPISITPIVTRKRTYISFGTKIEYYVEDKLVEDVG